MLAGSAAISSVGLAGSLSNPGSLQLALVTKEHLQMLLRISLRAL
jgi:hypothetical protein